MADAVLGQTVYRTSRNPVLMHITSMLPQYVHFMSYEPVTGPPGVSRDDELFWQNEWYTARY